MVDFKPHLHVIVLTHDILSRVTDSLSLGILTTVLRFVVYVCKTTLAHFWCLVRVGVKHVCDLHILVLLV